MFKRCVSLALAFLFMLSLSTIALPGNLFIHIVNAAGYYSAESLIEELTEPDGTVHTAELLPWDGSSQTAPEGDGTAEAPFQLSNGAELAWFAKYVNKGSAYRSAYAVLTKDINLNSKNWYNYRMCPTYNYTGVFDGQGHTIYNLYSANSSSGFVSGLFQYIGTAGAPGVVKNLNIVNGKIVQYYTGTSATDAGASLLCGFIKNEDTLIDNISVSGTITVSGSDISNVSTAGSIVGTVYGGTISNCYSDVIIDLSNAKNLSPSYTAAQDYYGVGGIVGRLHSNAASVVLNCGFGGTINAPYNCRVGGIVGNIFTYSNYRLNNCFNTGNITGLRQVAGIAGWVYKGMGAERGPWGIYNTGNITAKSSENSYAAGLVNGMGNSLLKLPSYSVGDVSVDDGSGNPGFNDKCALLYTTLATSTNWDDTVSAYASGKKYNNNGVLADKHILSSASGIAVSAANIIGYTEDEFKAGNANNGLYYSSDSVLVSFCNEKNMNNEYPVFTWQTLSPLVNGKTFFFSDETGYAEAQEEGYIYLDITPIGESAAVTVAGDEQTITKKGSYAFKVGSSKAELSVNGKALIYKDLLSQKKRGELTDICAEAIKVSIPSEESRTVILALYRDNILQDVACKPNAVPETDDNGESVVTAAINLKNKDVTDCMLRAFLWENGTVNPAENIEIDPLGKGEPATDEEKAQAIKEVAESYLARGRAIQYDATDINDYGMSRSTYGTKSPEDCTLLSQGYTNETAFIYDVYNEAFDIELPATVDGLMGKTEIRAAELDASELSNELETGDIVISNTGKAMLYTGDNKLIYAEGESYDYENGIEYYEAEGALKEAELGDIASLGEVTVIRPFMAEGKIYLNNKTAKRIEKLSGITAQKTFSGIKDMTVKPGDVITYTYSIENKNDDGVILSVKDYIPQYTEYVSGCDNLSGKVLSWNVTVPAGEEVSFSYKVCVDADNNVCGNSISGSKGTIEGIRVSCPELLVSNNLNNVDQSRVATAVKALFDSGFEDVLLAKWIYQVAFSRAAALPASALELLNQVFVSQSGATGSSAVNGEEIPDEAANIIDITVPGMYGGRAVSESVDAMFKTPRTRLPNTDVLLTGDILITQRDTEDLSTTGIYMYINDAFRNLSTSVMNEESAEGIFNELLNYGRYILLRPSAAMLNLNHYNEEQEMTLTQPQKAVLATAYSYLLRGGRMQYDDSALSSLSGGEWRWQKSIKQPEQYTAQETGYTNCAAFTYDVYYHALNYDIKTYTTSMLHSNSAANRVYSFAKTGNETDEEKQSIIETILSVLQPGDIICIRRVSGSGHAMLYVGNKTIMHSTGSSFNYNSSSETYEPTIRLRSVMDLFDSSTTADIFGVVQYFDVIRPLGKWSGTVPENTINRINNLYGIRAEKLSTHPTSKSVNPGEEITYTFALYNSNDEDKTLEIRDTVPENTTYVSGDGNISGSELSWSITVPAGEKRTVSYTVRVNSDAEVGNYLSNASGTVGGVVVKCPDILVANTLTTSEQEIIKTAIASNKGTSLTGVALANKIYSDAFGRENLLSKSTVLELMGSVFATSPSNSNGYTLNTASEYYPMIVPTLYGGRYFYSVPWENKRTRLAKPHSLVCGDIIIARTSSEQRIYIYDGEHFINLTTGAFTETDPAKHLEWMMAYQYYFAVLRPSFVM